MRSSNSSSRPSRRAVLVGGTAFGTLTATPRRARADQWPSRRLGGKVAKFAGIKPE